MLWLCAHSQLSLSVVLYSQVPTMVLLCRTDALLLSCEQLLDVGMTNTLRVRHVVLIGVAGVCWLVLSHSPYAAFIPLPLPMLGSIVRMLPFARTSSDVEAFMWLYVILR